MGEATPEELTQRYDSQAQAYLTYWAPVLEKASSKLIEGISIEPTRRILDIGSGGGTLLPLLEARYPDALIVGVDRSLGMMAHSPAGSLVVSMDALHLAFPDDLFDVAVMAFVLFHIPDPVKGLSQARRVLRPAGGIFLTTWATDIESPAVDLWNQELDASGVPAEEEIPRLAHHDLMDNTEKVEGLLASAGFRSARAEARKFNYVMERDDFLNLMTRVGSACRRLQTLGGAARLEFIDQARRKLAELKREDFDLEMRIILASARAP